MSHGTYTGYATYVSLTALYPSVTFTSTATIEADQGFAVVTGDQAGYSIFNYGVIIGKFNGIGSWDSANLVVNGGSTSLVEGYYRGIEGVGTIVNAGTIEATATSGVAVYLTSGSFTNEVGGVVVGDRTGVEAFGQTIVNSGTIKGNFGYGVQHPKELVNYGVVDSTGVAAAEYCYTILNYGLLESTGTVGDTSVNGVRYLTNENGGVILGTVRLESGGSVANDGRIDAGSYSFNGFAVAFYDFGYLTNTVDGVIDGGVRTFEDTVINRGTIDGQRGPGVLLQRSDLTNQTGGLITGLYGVSDESYATNFGTIEGVSIGVILDFGTLTNFGTILGDNGVAVQFYSKNADLIEEAPGVLIGVIADFSARDTIDLAGIEFHPNQQVSYDAGELVLYGDGGTYAELDMRGLTIVSGKALMAVDDGSGGVAIVESPIPSPGTVSDGEYSGVFASGVTIVGSPARFLADATVTNPAGIAALDAVYGATIANHGIVSGLGGIKLTGGGAQFLANFGTIKGTASGGFGAKLNLTGAGQSGTVMNDGTIKAPGGTALRLKLGDGASATVINGRYGLIKGAYGVVFAGQATGTLVDYGTIVGLADDAVAFQSADEALVVEGGAAVIGDVVGAGGLLELGGDGLAGTIGYLGSEVTGFHTYLIDASASWTLTDGNVMASGDQLTNAGSLVVLDGALTLDGGSSFTNTGQITVLGLESRLHDLSDLSGEGSITLTEGGILNLNGSAGGVIDFYGSGTLKLHEPLAVSSEIENFGVEGVIDLKDVPFSKRDTVSYTAGQLIVSGAAGVYADLAASGVIIPSGDQLALRNDGTGKTEIVIETSAQSADSQRAAGRAMARLGQDTVLGGAGWAHALDLDGAIRFAPTPAIDGRALGSADGATAAGRFTAEREAGGGIGHALADRSIDSHDFADLLRAPAAET